ncbi:MAG: S9 family peptidase [Gammaproteobacteria bacterium]|nr:S9 family peptidase [Gammaproteobacteria bacterium]
MKLSYMAMAALLLTGPAMASAASHPFNAHDLVMMQRLSDPQLSPDGSMAAFSLRQTDYAANKGATSIWVLDLNKPGEQPRKIMAGNSPHWSPDGNTLYFLSAKSGSMQLWSVAMHGSNPQQVSKLPLDINNYRLSPDGRHVLLSMDVFTDCKDIACTKARLDERDAQGRASAAGDRTLGAAAANKATGRLYTHLFVRHWDVWMNGRRSQLFIAALGTDGKLEGEPLWLTRGIHGDIPSKPEGDASEYTFSPDGKTVYFDTKVGGSSEAWTTNFNVYSVPADGSARPRDLTAKNPAWDGFPLVSPDGKTLYYLAQKTPGFESDRFAILARNLITGATHEVDTRWDRSAGALQISPDGKTLYTTADDDGNHALFAVNVASGKVSRLLSDGTVYGFDAVGDHILAARADFQHPADLYMLNAGGTNLKQVTRINAAQLADIRFSPAHWFTFKGWHGDTVHGYVIPPVNYVAGRKYPVAFLIHGGPQGAWNDEFHYRWNPEVYAGAGFAVVAVNFHGSTGYGQAFTDAISQHWGDRPLEDLQKGWAAALHKYPFLDAHRACALGASYGGYMVYWIAGVWNKPWKCLVDHDGVFDTRMMYYATDELWFEEHENGGPQYLHPAGYEKFNPLDHVKNWRVPMLVVHSNHDYRIPLSQGLGAFTALQRRGIPSEFLNFPDESHFVQKPQNSVQWHAIVLAWLKRWTSPQ